MCDEFKCSEFNNVCTICKSHFTKFNCDEIEEGSPLWGKITIYHNYDACDNFEICSVCVEQLKKSVLR